MLTESQLKTYKAIKEYIGQFGFSPSVRDLCEILEKAPCTIHQSLKILKRKGYIDYHYNKSRTIRITKDINNN